MLGFTKELQTASNLLAKLENDLARIKRDPGDVYAAFDFLVTAEQMPDWIGDTSIRGKHLILKQLSHVANSAKH